MDTSGDAGGQPHQPAESSAREMSTPAFQAVNAAPQQTSTTSSFKAVNMAPQQTSPDAAQPANSTNMPADATYGTRSRNRAGNPRPNYAEDQDMDFEYSTNASKKKAAATDSAASAAQSTGEAKRARDFAQLITNADGTPPVLNGASAKELTPGPAATVSKKRKAVGPPAALTQTPPTSNSPAQSATRKVAAPSAVARETNVMSFLKHKHTLNKKGELIADDGTKLSPNGKS